MRIAIERPDQADVMRLIEALDAHQIPLYPLESHHGVDIAALCEPDVVFAVARSTDRRAVGCGAMLAGAAYGELKRMYVCPDSRGQGIGKALLAFLESHAKARNLTVIKLETGNRQVAAIDLYSRSGYVPCGPFGVYVEDPHSIFMSRNLD